MTVALIPSAEAVIGAYLRTRVELTALVGERIGSRHPDDRTTPWVRITLIDELAAQSEPLHFVGARLQIDCYGGNAPDAAQSEADALSRAVRAALTEAASSDHDDAVVTGVTQGSRLRLPDGAFQPERERYVTDVTVWLHP